MKLTTKSTTRVNPYKKLFKKGAELTPRSFYFAELTNDVPDFDDRELHIKTSDAIKPDAKMPWKEIEFNGKIESQFIFRTALSKSILPFALYKPDLVALPILFVSDTNNRKKIKLLSVKELMNDGFLNASRWFQNAENIWAIHRTDKNKNIGAIDYVNWHSKLTEQNINAPYLVLYNSSAKDANATVIVRENIDLNFIVDTVTYVFYTSNKMEAYYLTAILNSSAPNEMMKDFQATGLFGARHVHKKILDIFYPKFNEKNKIHKQLAQLSEQAHEKTKTYLIANPPKQELSAIFLGRLRTDIKKHLRDEMKEIDELVKEVIG